MVKFLRRIFICAALLAISARAKDPADYQIGDKADADISTPVALDVIDAQATADLKSSEALRTPAIFESYPDVTNEIAANFLNAFAAARQNFAAAIQNTFHQTILTNSAIASPDFRDFVATFNAKNKNFPATDGLAAAWAAGGDGAVEQKKLLGLLQAELRHPIRPDETPFALGDTLRLVPMRNADEKPTLEEAGRARVIAVSSTGTISHERSQLRRELSPDEQPLARALAGFLKPDCLPDENLTQLVRERAIAGLAVDNHFDAGQIIIHRGETIDAKTKAALDELNEKMMPGVLSEQIAAEREREQTEQTQTQQAQEQAQLARQQQQQAEQENERAQAEAQRSLAQATAMRQQALLAQSQAREIRIRNEWLLAACAGISAVALLIFWRLIRQRHAMATASTMQLQRVEKNAAPEIAPQLAQVVKDALTQELAAQRRELLSAQQIATFEIAQIVDRLDELQIPLQERLRAYESQIQQLEKQLAARTEENRELLKMKIEMMRQQLEAERRRVDFN